MPRATGTGEQSVGTGRFWRVLRKKKNWGQCLSTSPRPAGAGHNDVRGVDSPPRAIKCRRMPLRSLSSHLPLFAGNKVHHTVSLLPSQIFRKWTRLSAKMVTGHGNNYWISPLLVLCQDISA